MNKTLADRLKFARAQSGLSQKALGECIHVSQTAIQKIEKGQSNSSTKLIDIAKALGVRPEWLSSGEDPMYATGVMVVNKDCPPEHEWQAMSEWNKDNSQHPRLLSDEQLEILEIFDGIPSTDADRILAEARKIRDHYAATFEEMRKRMGM